MQPIVKPLSIWRRKLVFGTLLLAFLIALPAFIFYAAGYRYDITAPKPVFTITGGFYIIADAVDSEIYIDDKRVTNARTFRDAYYIQGQELGLRRIHVQGNNLHTWTKELMVYPHIVTEVESFNLPLVPQVRLITNYFDAKNEAVVFAKSTSTPVLSGVASTTSYIVSTSTATTTLRLNPEFVLLKDLFLEKASTTKYIKSLANKEDDKNFGFNKSTSSTSTIVSSAELATTTVARDNLEVYENEGEVWVRTTSLDRKNIPRYFCTEQVSLDKILNEEVLDQKIEEAIPVETSLNNLVGDKLSPCRSEIKIQRHGREVLGFDFFPTSVNLVLMHLEDGIYVVEVDDRSWQNTQLLYGGHDLEVLIYREGIFIKENDLIFEILPEIATE